MQGQEATQLLRGTSQSVTFRCQTPSTGYTAPEIESSGVCLLGSLASVFPFEK